MKKKPDNKETSITRSSAAEYLTFITAKGEGGVEAIYADEDVWLSQKMMATLYDVNVRTINEHLKKLFSDDELREDSVIRKFRITAVKPMGFDRIGPNALPSLLDRETGPKRIHSENHLRPAVPSTVNLQSGGKP